MTTTLAAVVSQRGGPFVIERVELDDIRDDEALVEIVAVGICHTDLAIRDGDFPIPALPAILGHEGAGIVRATGQNVKAFKPGDHVVISFASCGKCGPCRVQHPADCAAFVMLNMQGTRADGTFVHSRDGLHISGSFLGQSSFAQHAVVPARNLVKVPDDAPLNILGPLGCAIQTGAGTVLNAIKPGKDSTIAIFGAGAVGLSAVMGASIAECKQIIVVDLLEERLALAREFGATDTINAADGNVADKIKLLTRDGADHIIEASGASPALEAAFASVRYGGSISIVGMPQAGAMITIPFAALMATSVSTVAEGASNPSEFIPILIEHYKSGRLPFDRLIRFYNFEDINDAAADAAAGRTIKPVLVMNSGAGR